MMRTLRVIQADLDHAKAAVQAALIEWQMRRRQAASLRRELSRAKKGRK